MAAIRRAFLFSTDRDRTMTAYLITLALVGLVAIVAADALS
ncbi:hypothetical protein ACRAVF_01125 [Bradyrhizobium oligotrophicum S58]